MSVSISTKTDDIIRYLQSRLEEDIDPDAMDSSLEADILKKIPEDFSERYVETTTLGELPQACTSTDRYISRFLLVSLNIDAVLQETTIHRRRQKLSAMTDGLGLGMHMAQRWIQCSQQASPSGFGYGRTGLGFFWVRPD